MPAPQMDTTQAADEINRLLAAAGSPRRVRPGTVKAWRRDRVGPHYRKVSGWFVEYEPAELARWVRDEYLSRPVAPALVDA